MPKTLLTDEEAGILLGAIKQSCVEGLSDAVEGGEDADYNAGFTDALRTIVTAIALAEGSTTTLHDTKRKETLQ